MNPFEELLAPFDRERFFAEHWGRRSLCVGKGGAKFERLPGLARLPALLAGKLDASAWTPSHESFAQASFVDSRGAFRNMPAAHSAWPALFNAGVSLCFGPLDRFDEELTRLVDAFRKDSRNPGKIVTTCYLTPPHSGSAMHFDRQNVFFLQVSGKKHWKYGSKPAWTDPPINFDADALSSPQLSAQLAAIGVPSPSRPEETELVESVLEPGDVLYLPPGTWHEARTTKEHSLHYTLTFEPLSAWNLIYAFLRMQLIRQPSWRTDLRYESSETKTLATALDALRDALARATPEDLQSTFAMIEGAGSLKSFFSTKS